MAEKEPRLNYMARKKMIELCKKWTAKDGYFPNDNGTDFENMSDRTLMDYHSCYKWALDEDNFHSHDLQNKKGG